MLIQNKKRFLNVPSHGPQFWEIPVEYFEHWEQVLSGYAYHLMDIFDRFINEQYLWDIYSIPCPSLNGVGDSFDKILIAFRCV